MYTDYYNTYIYLWKHIEPYNYAFTYTYLGKSIDPHYLHDRVAQSSVSKPSGTDQWSFICLVFVLQQLTSDSRCNLAIINVFIIIFNIGKIVLQCNTQCIEPIYWVNV